MPDRNGTQNFQRWSNRVKQPPFPAFQERLFARSNVPEAVFNQGVGEIRFYIPIAKTSISNFQESEDRFNHGIAIFA
jgi:hypothetical protein